MSQGPYQPGYEPADGAPPSGRPPHDSHPDAPTGRATARVPQPEWGSQPEWAPPPAPPGPPPGSPSGPPPGSPSGPSPYGTDQPYGAPVGQGGFGAPPPQAPPGPLGPPGPPTGRASGSASVPGAAPAGPGYGQQPTFTPAPGGGTYGSPSGPLQPSVYGSSTPYSPAPPGSSHGSAPYAGPEQSRFANLRYDDPAVDGAPTKSKRGLVIGVVVAAVLVLALVAGGVTWFLSRSSSSAGDFAVNSCVKKSDTKAVDVSCSTDGAYQIVSKVETVDKCPDRNQPYVVLQEPGKSDQVLCLKPAR